MQNNFKFIGNCRKCMKWQFQSYSKTDENHFWPVRSEWNWVEQVEFHTPEPQTITKKVFDQGLCFVSGHDDDYVFLCNVYDNNFKMCMSPYVKYFVNNASHTEMFPEKGRRMVLNGNKQ